MKSTVILFLFCLLNFLPGFSQEEQAVKRPKIGVVLSGGGAKGISHIGVLKAMEKAGIRPDYITGTSMGAVIGGLYAMGYSADTLQKIVASINWDQVLSNKIPLHYIAYEEKFYYDRYLINFPIDVKEGFKIMLPNGLIEGQMLSELLSDYTWSSSKYDNFDEFPIPFRCVATDVSTGKEHIFKDGPLSLAMRSSMAIPTAFTSVDVDSTLFVDGGILNNFPVELVKEMGADIIIGVNVSSTGFDNAKDINNIPGILMQMAMINSLDKLPGQIEECDIYVAPELEGYSTASFGSYMEILEVGDRAGDKFLPEFMKLAEEYHLTDTAYKGIPIEVEPIIINEVKLTGNTLTPDKVILGKLNIKAGDFINREDIENGVRSVFGLNNFNKVVYYIEKKKDKNEYDLLIVMNEKLPTTLSTSFHYDNTFSAGIVVNLTLKNLLLKGSRAIFLTDISENPKFRVDYLKYMGKHQHFALNAIYDYQFLEIPFYDKGEIIDYGNNNFNNFSLLALTTNSLKHSFSLGYEYSQTVQKSKFLIVGGGDLQKANFQYNNILANYYRNSLNDRNFPTQGSSTEILTKSTVKSGYSVKLNPEIYTPELEDLYNEIVDVLEPGYFFQMLLFNESFVHFTSKFQIIPSISFGLTFSSQDTIKLLNNFVLGGFQRINTFDTRVYGLNYSEIDDANFGLLGISFQNVLFKSLYIQYGFNLLSHYKYVPIDNLASIDWNELFDQNTLFGYGIELRYKSLIGPISLGVSRNTEDSYYRFYFQLGYSFNYTD